MNDGWMKRALLAVLGAVLFGLGVLVGDLGSKPAEARTAQTVTPDRAGDDVELRAALSSLTNELAALREDAAMRATNLDQELRRLGARTAPTPVDSDSNEPVLGDAFDWQTLDAYFDDLRMRLDAIAEIQQRMAAQPTSIAAEAADFSVPAGMNVRDYMRTLKYVDDGAQVARAHQFWTNGRVRNVYGPPDEIIEHDDYIEWIYRLDEEGEQFDFHFVNGLCVQAH